MFQHKLPLCSLVIAVLSASSLAAEPQLQPWPENPYYWQYRGRPTRLVGGSDDDNLFQMTQVEKHLDEIAAAGGNYIRNTMSDRPDKGFEVYPFAKLEDGKYDLTKWNDEYWNRFENLLRECERREIIVQIEIWDRFDYSRENWEPHPYNPKNNINYSFKKSGFEEYYPKHPGRNEQPFFFTVPELDNNQVVLKFQNAFVDKLLDISLKYPNVLYCIDNETSAEAAWPIYWTKFIRQRAKDANKSVNITEMWDDWNIKGGRHANTYDHPQRYDFVDVSQNNHNSGQEHWDNLMWVREHLEENPRPINHVKIYGADTGKYGTTGDGIERFWRCAIGGAAAFRFHRPDSGLGLSDVAAKQITAFRDLEEAARLFRCQPDADSRLLDDREKNEAYLTYEPGKQYILYFPRQGAVTLDLSDVQGEFQLLWLNPQKNTWTEATNITAGEPISLNSPSGKHAIAVITRR